MKGVMETNQFSVILVIVILLIWLLLYQMQSMRRKYRAAVINGFARTDELEDKIISEEDIHDLPEPVQKYLRYVGVIGKPKVRNYRIAFTGEMKLGLNQDWTKVQTEQFNFVVRPTRLFFIQARRAGLPFVGIDSYTNGKGNMLIKVMSIFTVCDAWGVEMDAGEMVTLFNDMCLYAPAALLDSKIRWETIDPLTAIGTYQAGERKVSATLYFNEEGQLVNFVTDDRYYSPIGKDYLKVRWSTPVKEYREINGLRVPTYGEGVWHFPAGDFCYAKFTLKEFQINCKGLK